MPLDSEPPGTHAQYDRINKLLHAHYALGGLPRCVVEGGEALKQCLAALRASPPTDQFVVAAPFGNATVEQLIDLLPPTLQRLELQRARMKVVPESVGKFTALLTLSLSRCSKLAALPESVGNFGALHTLNLPGCEILTALPESVGNLGALQTLNLSYCYSLTALPESVGNLGALCTLTLRSCKTLAALPESVGNLSVLQTLDLTDCTRLKSLPASVGNLGALYTLNLQRCEKLTALPESVGNLGALHTLGLSECSKLKTLPATISQLTQLDFDSREEVEAILRGAPTALPFAAARECTAFAPPTQSASAPFVFGLGCLCAKTLRWYLCGMFCRIPRDEKDQTSRKGDDVLLQAADAACASHES
jgi:hypothetical protein